MDFLDLQWSYCTWTSGVTAVHNAIKMPSGSRCGWRKHVEGLIQDYYPHPELCTWLGKADSVTVGAAEKLDNQALKCKTLSGVVVKTTGFTCKGLNHRRRLYYNNIADDHYLLSPLGALVGSGRHRYKWALEHVACTRNERSRHCTAWWGRCLKRWHTEDMGRITLSQITLEWRLAVLTWYIPLACNL